MDQRTFEARVPGAPGWVQRHWETFEGGILGRRNETPFPCFFAAESLRAGEPLFTVCPSMDDPEHLLQLGETLQEYLATYEDHADRASLVTFFAPSAVPLSEREWHEALWHILQFLHVHDPEPWPADIPTDPDTETWEFSYAGEPMFPTCRAPFYEQRKSRYCPVGLEITFQPRTLFETVGVTAETEFGQRAREVIQDRLRGYDGHPPHPHLGDWGVDGDREWHQYMLPEDDEQAPDSCPIRVTREHPKVPVANVTPSRGRRTLVS